MKYTLIMPNGKVMLFYVESVAQTYQKINGGVIVTNEILKEYNENPGYLLV
jgi:hypothetical protein